MRSRRRRSSSSRRYPRSFRRAQGSLRDLVDHSHAFSLGVSQRERRGGLIELLIATVISGVSEWGLGRHLGPPRLNDDGSEEAMVDVHFLDTDPIAAMEVTSIVDSRTPATVAAAERARVRRLESIAAAAAVPMRWTVQLVAGTQVSEIIDVVEAAITDGNADLGLVDLPGGLMRIDAEPAARSSVDFAVWSGIGAGALTGIGTDLELAIASNRDKLARAEGFERHLAVDVQALRSSDPARTPVPELPPSIDYLWVTRRSISAQRSQPVVWVTDGTGAWLSNGEPHDAL